MIQRAWKTFVISYLMGHHIVLGSIVKYTVRDPWKRRKILQRMVSRHSKVACAVFGIKIDFSGLENAKEEAAYLVVGNHLSYLDVLIMSSFRPLCYVTSMEIKQTPFLGLLTEVGGCLYVERRSRENIQNEIGEIELALKEGLSVVVFPEATSTNGEQVLPFKRSLFLSAVKSGCSVLPTVIQYDAIDGKPVSKENRDKLCWYGDMRFAGHFFGLMAMKEINVSLKVLPEIPVEPDSTRDKLMEQAQKLVHENYEPIK